MADDPVITALRAALDREESVEVRVALTDRLLAVDSLAEALACAEAAVSKWPSDPRTLECAANAAERAGDADRAAAYRAARAAFESEPEASAGAARASPTTRRSGRPGRGPDRGRTPRVRGCGRPSVTGRTTVGAEGFSRDSSPARRGIP